MVINKNILINYTSWVYDLTNRYMTALRGHKYHILPLSSSPITISVALLLFLLTLVFNFHGAKVNLSIFDKIAEFLIRFSHNFFFNSTVQTLYFSTINSITIKNSTEYLSYQQAHLFWIAPFLITLGIFFLWSSNAIAEGTTTKVNFLTIKKNSFVLAAKVLTEPLYHTDLVRKGFKIGFILFIISEVMFFFGFFWSFFHSSISPTVQIGAVWPPLDVEFITVKGFAIANTVILLTSGATLTVAHYAFELIPQKKNKLYEEELPFTDSEESYEGRLNELYHYLNKEMYQSSLPESYTLNFIKIFFINDSRNEFNAKMFQFILPIKTFFVPLTKHFERNLSIKDTETLAKIYINLMLDLTLILALLFMIFQGTEYFISPVNINTGVYGSTFYMITGLHGAHVFIGTCFLLYCRTAVAPARNFRTIFLVIYFFLNFLALKLTEKITPAQIFQQPDEEYYAEGVYEEILEEQNPVDHYGRFGIESFESAAWYWHFVDVVWIFVFGFVYVWSHLTVLDLQ